MFTNVNIIGFGEVFQYAIEYNPVNIIGNGIKYVDNVNANIRDSIYNNISFWNGPTGYIKHYNEWVTIDKPTVSKYIPDNYFVSKLNLYFPRFSIDDIDYEILKYYPMYSLTAYTWINHVPIVLGSFIFNRTEALACDKLTTISGHRYNEMISFDILDIRSLLYSEEWSEFRKHVCGEPSYINSDSGTIYVTLDPVIEVDGKLIKCTGLEGGQNLLNIFKKQSDKLNLHLSTNVWEPLGYNNEPKFELTINFNDIYNGNLKEYLEEVYSCGEYSIVYELVIGNKNDIYAILNSDETKSVKYTF